MVTQDYKQKEDIWFDDGREERLLEYVKEHLDLAASNKSEEVIRLIDEFGVNHHYMMNVGARKGRIVTEVITQRKPKTMIELGSYIGYSTVLFAAAMRDAGGQEYISFEREPKFARVAAAMVELAGLANHVRFVIGPSSNGLVEEHKAGRLSQADVVFLDHYKPAYVKDLKIMESLGVIRVNTVLVADNVIEPGNPTYLEYVRSTPEKKQQRLKGEAATSDDSIAFPSRAVNQYTKEYATDKTELPGLPGIVYKSRIEHSHEPTGVPDGIEITVCLSLPSPN
ncbi:catechol O-methyltransferase [Pseudovirgaria hyperparasitica]|uniref:catechol O-methyltransferase n=1 Tax=Pseudovirgaria hyperparasitica TaxID=470096 RepID=A0A6A6WFW2_9PEZI|nr:catechol O-methyltransferase [Pseudovirgaria hyperparasitica]KAF2761688.1 catechol O-methyltransferase [Pseudovirgaria hyperparasitica]